jgi:hypothetical protein
MSYQLVAVKRRWCPDWLFALMGQLILHQPLRWIFTIPANGAALEKFDGD